MKAIIDGMRFDTGAATEVARDSWGYANDFEHFTEGLYRTERGAWFLAGEGGAMSKYARPVSGGGTGGGEKIIPLTAEDARNWLERNDETEAIEQHFEIDDA